MLTKHQLLEIVCDYLKKTDSSHLSKSLSDKKVTQDKLKDVEIEKSEFVLEYSEQNKNIPELIKKNQESIRSEIKALRKKSFSDVRIGPNGEEIYIKYQQSGNQEPTDPYEARIQALKYLDGMLLIAAHSPVNMQEYILKDIKVAFNKYERLYKIQGNDPQKSSELTQNLYGEFADILVQSQSNEQHTLSLNEARNQVNIARDLALQLQQYPVVITITQDNTDKNKYDVDYCESLPVDEEFYTDEMFELWVKSGTKKAGLENIHNIEFEFNEDLTSPSQKQEEKEQKTHILVERGSENWLHNFIYKNKKTIKKFRNPSAPSSRYTPIPSNTQIVRRFVIYDQENKIEENQERFHVSLSDMFVRMGITTSFNLSSKNSEAVQQKYALKQLKSVVKSIIKVAIDEYKEAYKGLYDEKNPKFIIDYMTLLSPIIIEQYAYKYHKDNNSKFVEMKKIAMKELTAIIYDVYKELIPEGTTVDTLTTNSPVNSMAAYAKADSNSNKQMYDLSKKYLLELLNKMMNLLEPDNQKKLQYIINDINEVQQLLSHTQSKKAFIDGLKNGTMLKGIRHDTQVEIANRIVATIKLRELLYKDKFYELPYYQQNIIKAALENLALGKQALKLIGCKSARDRTAVIAAATKAIQDNPDIVDDWNKLNSKIIQHLEEGHHFRAMMMHVAIVKVNDVKKELFECLSLVTQNNIKHFKGFIKTISEKKNKGSTKNPVDLSELNPDEGLSLEDSILLKLKERFNRCLSKIDGTEEKNKTTTNYLIHHKRAYLIKAAIEEIESIINTDQDRQSKLKQINSVLGVLRINNQEIKNEVIQNQSKVSRFFNAFTTSSPINKDSLEKLLQTYFGGNTTKITSEANTAIFSQDEELVSKRSDIEKLYEINGKKMTDTALSNKYKMFPDSVCKLVIPPFHH